MAINRDKVHAAAAKLLQQGKFDKAIAELVKLVEDDSTDVRTWLKLGETWPKIGKKKEALDAFEKAANIYAEQGFFLKAVAVLKQLLRVDPNVPPMHLKLAELYQQLGLTPDALQHYQNVAVFYEQQGRARDTLDILKRMVDLDPDNLPSRIKLGELFAQQGLQQEATHELRSALSFLKGQSRFDDYARVAEKLIAYDAGALDVARELAQIYLTQKQPSLALSKLQIAFKVDSRNVTTLTLMAQAFLDMQQVPKTVLVYKELARIHTTDGNADQAQRQWEQVLELSPDDAEATMALGRAPAGAPASFAAAPFAAAPFAAAPSPAPFAGGPSAAPSAPSTSAAAFSGASAASAAAAATLLPQGGAGAPRARADAPAADANAELLTRLITETDVYVKYGLKDKALEHLKKIYAIKSDHIPALEKERQLLQPIGGRELKDVMRRLVSAADDQGHPRLAEWKTELSQTDNKPASAVRQPTVVAASPVLSASRSHSSEDIVIESQEGQAASYDEPILGDAPGGLSLDPSEGDEPFLGGEISSLPDLPPDEGGADAFGADPVIPTLEPSLSSREIPRMPSGVMAMPARPVPLAMPTLRTPDAPLELSEEAMVLPDGMLTGEDDAQADDIVRQALRDISQEDLSAAADDLLLDGEEELLSADGDIVEEQPDEPMIPAPAPRAPAHSPLESALVQAGSEEGPYDDAIGGAFDSALDAAARAAMAEPAAVNPAAVNPAAVNPAAAKDVSSTALMGLSSDELDEIREFEGDTHDPEVLARGPQRAVKSVPSGQALGQASVPPEMSADLEDFGFDEPTLAPPPGKSSESPTGERARGGAAGFAEPSGEFDPASFDLPDDVKAMLGASAALSRSAEQAPAPQAAAELASEGAPAGATQPQPAAGKLGLAAKAQGFEEDPANQFFPDELEESEFFIQQELLDEAREILTNILEDVPDSPRVQWMLARIDAKEAGEPEPAAPWEKRILEEVQAQLDEFDIPAPPEQPVGERQVSVEEVLSQFKKGIAETVPEDDAATHYDLGCAYRDMGLLDDALSEFAIAARAPSRAADARYLIGVTLADQGRSAEAIAALTDALASPGTTRDQRAACQYQLGVCHEDGSALSEALAAFKQAKALGHAAVDLDRRISTLIGKVGDVEPGGGSNGSNGHGHSKAPVVPQKAKNIDYL